MRWVSVTVRSNMCVGQSYTSPYDYLCYSVSLLLEVTVAPSAARSTCSLRARTARSARTRCRCWAASGPRRLNLMRAAEGWRSCAEGVPASRCAASASSALSSEEHTKDRLSDIAPPVPLSACTSSSATVCPQPLWSVVFFDSFFQNHFTENNKCCTKSARCWTETEAFEILPDSSSTALFLSSDESSRKQTTNSETQSKEISEIRQSTWVITQVLTFIPAGIGMGFCSEST